MGSQRFSMSLSTSDRSLELLARLGILSGVAGVMPRAWTGRGDAYSLMRGMKQARAALPLVADEWFVVESAVLVDAIREGSAGSESAQDVEDAVIDILCGFSRSENVEGGQLYDMGRKLAPAPRLSTAVSYLQRHAAHRVWRRGSVYVEAVAHVPEVEWQAKDVGARLDEVSGDRRWIMAALEAAWRTAPGKLAIAKVWLSDPSLSAVDVARAMGHGEQDEVCWIDGTGSATYVAKVLRTIPATVRDAVPAGVAKYVADGVV